jgi:hypothetical protein
LSCDARAMPLGVTITGANANDGVQTQDVLQSLVIQPEPPQQPVAVPDERSLPTATGDGAYNNRPTKQRAKAAGFRMQAPKRGRRPTAWARFATRWSGAITSSLSSAVSAVASTAATDASSGGCNWPRVSSSSARVLSGSP